jgi:hypothetical protein
LKGESRRRKREEGRGKREEGRGKREEVRKLGVRISDEFHFLLSLLKRRIAKNQQ